MKKHQRNRLVFSNYLCPRKRWFLMSRLKRTRHIVASAKVILLLLLRQCLSNDAWTRILSVPSITALRARATRSSSSSKVAQVVGSPYAGQGAVPLCSTPVMTSRERSTWSGSGGDGGMGVTKGHIEPLGTTME